MLFRVRIHCQSMVHDLSRAPWSFTPIRFLEDRMLPCVKGWTAYKQGHPVTLPPLESSGAGRASLIHWVFHQLRHKARILRPPGQTLGVIGPTSSRDLFHLPSPGRGMPSVPEASLQYPRQSFTPDVLTLYREMYAVFRKSLTLPPERPFTRPTRFRSVLGIQDATGLGHRAESHVRWHEAC